MQKLSRSLIALGGLAALAACGDDVSITPPAVIPAAVVGVTVSPASLTLKVGESATLGVSVETTGGAGSGVTWASSTPAVATVSATGAVTAVAAGNTTVRATSTVDNTKSGAAQVTVTAPVVRSVTVTPSALALTVGGTGNAVATVDRDAPLAGTVTWASSATAVATVSTAGVISAVAAGNAVITATSTADPSKLAALAVTVSAIPNNLLSLNVAPASVNVGPGATQQLTSTVNTVGSPTVTYTYTTGNAGVATVSGTGLVTGVAQGTTVITVSAATNTNTLTTSVTVNVSAASVSIASLTTSASGTTVPVNLAGVAGQIEATLNINSGAQQIAKVDVLIDNIVAATQNFGVNGAPNAPVTLSINTAEFDMNYVAKWINGPRTISAKITPANGGSPTASNTIQFTLANADVVYFNPAGLTHTGNSATGPTTAAGTTYWKGGFTFSAFVVAYSGQVATVTYTSDDCGAQTATASPWVAAYACSGVENVNGNEQQITNNVNDVALTYNAGYTLTASPTTFMIATSTGYVPGKPVYAAVLTNEDNVGPTTPAPTLTNAGAAGGAGGNWLGTPAGFSSVATDAGVGMGTQPTINGHANDAGPTLLNSNITNVCAAAVASNSNMPETLNPTSYVAQATGAVDALGNAGSASGVSGAFGVDCAVSDVKYLNQSTPAAAPVANVYTTATQTAFTAAPVANLVGGEAIDLNGRSGLWNVNAPFSDAHGPMVQTIARLAPGVNSNCYAGPQGPFTEAGVSALWENMPTILTNNYAQSTPTNLFCAGASGYYTWSANVWDRALNTKAVPYHTTSTNTVVTALDLLAPNVTGIGFVNALYTGGSTAPFSISANDDLEVIEAQIGLTYADAGGTTTLRYPFGSAGMTLNNGTGTNQTWGVRWDNAISSTLNAGEASVNFFLSRLDSVVANNATNLAGYVTAGDSLETVSVEVNDVAATASNLLSATVLNTQLTLATTQFGGLGTNMQGFTVNSTAAGQLIMEQVGISGTATQQCTSFILWRVNGAFLDYVSALSTTPVITDNGTNRFFTYTVTGLTAGNYRAMCVRNGTGLFSTTQAVL